MKNFKKYITPIIIAVVVLIVGLLITLYYFKDPKGHIRWLSTHSSKERAVEWLDIMESSSEIGLSAKHYRTAELRRLVEKTSAKDTAKVRKVEKQLTNTIAVFIRHLQQGNIKFDYDEINQKTDSAYRAQILKIGKSKKPSLVVSLLECNDLEYKRLKQYLKDSITPDDSLKQKAIMRAMNYARYFSVNRKSECIIVNIPALELNYYKNGKVALNMKTVVGTPETPTPTIASHIYRIEVFPYWSVPRSIAVKEILPEVKKNPIYLKKKNFDVVDDKGRVVDETKIAWLKYNEKNFPFYFRQSTGKENSLGVLKFQFANPFSVYLHDTSFPIAFSRRNRYLSHGCVRLENPYDLAHELSRGAIDVAAIKNHDTEKKQETERKNLSDKVAVFIINNPVKISDNGISFYKDVYGVLK